VVLTISSGAALRGSPLSGGYAGAKATVRFISAYATILDVALMTAFRASTRAFSRR
jgi:hypothetical protein